MPEEAFHDEPLHVTEKIRLQFREQSREHHTGQERRDSLERRRLFGPNLPGVARVRHPAAPGTRTAKSSPSSSQGEERRTAVLFPAPDIPAKIQVAPSFRIPAP